MDKKIRKKLYYILQFIDSARFMASALVNYANKLSEEIQNFKCKYRYDDKKCENCRTRYKYCDYFFENASFKNNLIEYKCLCCKKNVYQKFDEKLKKRFFNRYKSSDNDNNKFILL